tara:strand:- start:51 stop:1148 length:1098 start_codon:yes stop_codon:yes gene_type:complete
MKKITKLEYVWLDGYETPNIRSKTKYMELDEVSLSTIPEWGFDGSSTTQAPGNDSDCVLSPVKIYRKYCDSFFSELAYIVLCEVMNKDGLPHESNYRSKLGNLAKKYSDHEMLFGIEQEYVIVDTRTNRPFDWPKNGFPNPQGRYYCGIGGDVITSRWLPEEHAFKCLAAKIPLCGTNAEVMMSQWEYQIGIAGPLDICDDLWISRYTLEMIAENYKHMGVSLDPKPVDGDWNGSGAHINFSTKYMRDVGGDGYIKIVCEELEKRHYKDILNYGIGNGKRLTGNHETQSIDKFTWGRSDRGASIRIPPSTSAEDKGYLEDRRPSANMDPYRAVACLVDALGSVESNMGLEEDCVTSGFSLAFGPP